MINELVVGTVFKIFIAPDKRAGISQIFFSDFSMKTYILGTQYLCLGEAPEHMFSWRNKKNNNNFLLKKCTFTEAIFLVLF